MSDMEKEWVKSFKKALVGKTVKSVRIMTGEEAEELDWHARPVVITFFDGHSIYASQDDEGNGPGALFTTYEELPTIPVFY